jgi:hypothetical protein
VLARTLTPMSAIPDQLQVVFLTLTTDKADLAEMAKGCNIKALHVRGKLVAMWSCHLSKVGFKRHPPAYVNVCCIHP